MYVQRLVSFKFPRPQIIVVANYPCFVMCSLVTSWMCDETRLWRVDRWRVDRVMTWPCDEMTVWRVDWYPCSASI